MPFKDRLKEARKAKGLTQEQLGAYLQIAKSTIAGYERGSSEPDMLKLQKIMFVLEIDANFLFQDEMQDIKKNSSETNDEVILSQDEKKNHFRLQSIKSKRTRIYSTNFGCCT